MLTTYFKHPFTLHKLRSGPAGRYLDDYASHLTQQGYSQSTARRHLRAAGHFSAWDRCGSLSGSLPDPRIRRKAVPGLALPSRRLCVHWLLSRDASPARQVRYASSRWQAPETLLGISPRQRVRAIWPSKLPERGARFHCDDSSTATFPRIQSP